MRTRPQPKEPVRYTLADYDPDGDFDHWYTDETAKMIDARLIKSGARTIVEVGSATGRMTERLAGYDRQIIAVERDVSMMERAIARALPGVSWLRDDFMELQLNPVFDAVVCALVLHELTVPREMLQRCAAALASHDRARVYVTVPNAKSLHQQQFAGGAGAISARGVRYGVKRLWDQTRWSEELITGTGLRLMERQIMMAKPFPNEQMACLSPDVLDHLAAYRGPAGAICFFALGRA